ncbi:MAG: TetR/AcrR family transcriptional regulator [Pseudomonadota bacterium]|nr:TetR/AcrR family transcriptional regulator [Pseudomonadota bacterium]
MAKSKGTRQKIKDAALECFLTYGFRGTTIALIARKTKTSKPLVLYHYKNTEVLLFELMNEWAQSGKSTTDLYLQKLLGHPPRDIIVALQDATFDWMVKYPKMASFSTVLFQAAIEVKEVQKFLFQVFEGGRLRIDTLLKQIPRIKNLPEFERKGLATSIHCLIFGSSLYIVGQGQKGIMKHTKEFNVRAILHALA